MEKKRLSTTGIRIRPYCHSSLIFAGILFSSFIAVFFVFSIVYKVPFIPIVAAIIYLVDSFFYLWPIFGREHIRIEGQTIYFKKVILFISLKQHFYSSEIAQIDFNPIDPKRQRNFRTIESRGMGRGKVVITLTNETVSSFGSGLSDEDAIHVVDELKKRV